MMAECAHEMCAYEHFEELPSTQAYLSQWITTNQPDADYGPRAVVAHRQTDGYGRNGRQWYSEGDESIALSVAIPLIREGVERRLSWLPILAGLAVATVCAQHAAGITVKWPNDILRDGRKIGGIIAEDIAPAGHQRWAVVGIGLNLALRTQPTAHSASLLSAEVSPAQLAELRETVIADILTEFLTRVEDLRARPDATIKAMSTEYQELSILHGADVVVNTPSGSIEGTVWGLGPDGSLLLGEGGGHRPAIVRAGDVVSLRGAHGEYEWSYGEISPRSSECEECA